MSELTVEEAWGIPLEEAGRLLRSARNDVALAEAPTFEEMRAKLGRPAGVGGLPSGLMGLATKALDAVYCAKGEHVVENVVSRYGVCRLRVVRMGKPVEAQLYFDQLSALDMVHGLEGWTWRDRSSGQEMHVLLLCWVQG